MDGPCRVYSSSVLTIDCVGYSFFLEDRTSPLGGWILGWVVLFHTPQHRRPCVFFKEIGLGPAGPNLPPGGGVKFLFALGNTANHKGNPPGFSKGSLRYTQFKKS